MGYNPHIDENGNCVNCGTGQLNFDGKSTGCACSRVADAEYETEQRIIKLLEDEMLSDDDTPWQTRDWQEVERQQDRDWAIKEAIALIKGENNGSK